MVSQSKKEYLSKIKDRYRHASKAGRSHILDEFCAVCGHHRKHAIRLLRADARTRHKHPGRPSLYGEIERRVLESIWLNSDRPCAKRMSGMIRLWLKFYEKEHGDLDQQSRENLLNLTSRTLDRLLVPIRKKHGARGLSGTRRGNYLKSSIPLKISHTDVTEPGFVQADTVAHCGDSLEGSFVWSLTFTDIISGWTENGAVWNKGQYGVYQLLQTIENRLPFCLKGFHTDNGGEFINHHLHSYYCERATPVLMTRGRPGRKNDNPHVEQKNWTHVRLLLGYQRIEDETLVKDINALYEATGLFNNFFCTSTRLVFKERRGAKYYKRYDMPATPCERLLNSGHLNELQKTHLTDMLINLDPYKLRKQIDAKLKAIFVRLR